LSEATNKLTDERLNHLIATEYLAEVRNALRELSVYRAAEADAKPVAVSQYAYDLRDLARRLWEWCGELRQGVDRALVDDYERLVVNLPPASPAPSPANKGKLLVDAINAEAPAGKVLNGALTAAIYARANDAAPSPADREGLRKLAEAVAEQLFFQSKVPGANWFCLRDSRGVSIALFRPAERDNCEAIQTGVREIIAGRVLDALTSAVLALLDALAAAERGRDQAIAEANRRDRKWMDGINEIVGEKLSYDFPDGSASRGLDTFVRELRRERDDARAKLAAAEGAWDIIERAGEVTLTVSGQSVEAWRTPSGTPNWCIEVGAVGAANTMLECLTMGLAALARPADPGATAPATEAPFPFDDSREAIYERDESAPATEATDGDAGLGKVG
jgi:hypothetical protein